MNSPADICLAHFPFGGSAGSKLRPVLLLTGPLGSVPEFLVAYMTSVIPTTLYPWDILLDPGLPEHAGTHLKNPTLVRLHKLATIHNSDIARHVGVVPKAIWAEVELKLRALLNF